MEKLGVSLILVFLSLASFAQYFPLDRTVYGRSYKGIKPSKAFKVQTEIDSTFNKKGKFLDRELKQYNFYGNMLFREWDKGRKKTYYEIYRDSIYKSAYTLHKGDTGGFWCYSFVENGSPICYQYGHKKAKNIRITDSTIYDAKGRRQKVMSYGRKNKLTGYSTYSYNDSGSIAEYRNYDKNAKLKRIYSYSCNSKGEALKEVKQTNYCKSEGVHQDGRFYEVIETRNEKGKLRRQIYTYSKDSLLLEYEYTSVDGKPKGKSVYKYTSNGFISAFANYNAKGKLNYTYEYDVNERGYRIAWRQYNNKGKLLSVERSHYTWYN